MAHAYVSLGSNLGDRLAYLSAALRALRDISNSVVASPIYETEPVEVPDGAAFLNAAVIVDTGKTVREFFGEIKTIEAHIGRRPETHMKPREIDIDLLLFDDLAYEDENIIVPHAKMGDRRFVLQPLCDIAPDVVHPVFHKTIQDLLNSCNDQHRIMRTPYFFKTEGR